MGNSVRFIAESTRSPETIKAAQSIDECIKEAQSIDECIKEILEVREKSKAIVREGLRTIQEKKHQTWEELKAYFIKEGMITKEEAEKFSLTYSPESKQFFLNDEEGKDIKEVLKKIFN